MEKNNQTQEAVSHEQILDLISEEIDANSEIVQEQRDNQKNEQLPNGNHAIIFVMSGLHKGAACPINNEATIGSDFNNDLILTDDDIASEHLVLVPVEDGLNYGIKLVCKGDNVVINGEILLTTNQTLILQDTFILTIGTVNINVTLYKSPKITAIYKKYMAPQLRAVEELGTTTKKYLSLELILSDIRNVILIFMSLLCIIIFIIYMFGNSNEKKPLGINDNKFSKIKELSIKEVSNNTELQLQAKDELQHIFEKYGLKSRLNILIKKSVIYVEGNLNQYEFENWSKVLNWFDTAYGSKINLVQLISVNNGIRRTISFKAVVVDGKIPYVVSWTGDRFKPGATLPGGWIILNISEKGVTVKDAVDNRIFLVQHIRSQYGEAIPNFIE